MLLLIGEDMLVSLSEKGPKVIEMSQNADDLSNFQPLG